MGIEVICKQNKCQLIWDYIQPTIIKTLKEFIFKITEIHVHGQ
jgi:hypothetical protein